MADLRLCRACRQRKPLSEFYVHRHGRPYLDCKPCWREYVRGHRAANAEYYRAFDRARADDPKRVQARREYAKSLPASYHQEKARQWRERNREKRAAQITAGNAIRDRRLVPEPCQRCGEVPAHAHHEDYSKPLDVTWLCASCHGQRHREINEERRKSDPQLSFTKGNGHV